MQLLIEGPVDDTHPPVAKVFDIRVAVKVGQTTRDAPEARQDDAFVLEVTEKLPCQVGMVLDVVGLKSAQLGEIVLEGLGLFHVVGEDVVQRIRVRLGVLALVHRFGFFGLLSPRDKSRLQQSGLPEDARQFVLASPTSSTQAEDSIAEEAATAEGKAGLTREDDNRPKMDRGVDDFLAVGPNWGSRVLWRRPGARAPKSFPMCFTFPVSFSFPAVRCSQG